ncbi:MAG: tetratricopeptide repeat protein [Ignavibacteriales bacterium]|nr:tetratricopeptide repeat protein [Ignavibacteriales bacterium]
MKTMSGIAFLCLLVSFPASGQTKFEKAVRLYDDGKIPESKALFLEAIKEDARNADAYYYLGMISIDSDYEGAIDYLEKAVELVGTEAKYHFMLGNAYGVKAQRAGIFSKLGAASDCKEQYLTAISLDPKYTDARMRLIEFYLEAPGIAGGSEEKAAAEADTIKTYDPYAGYLAKARFHQYRKEKAQEEECYLKAISTDPKKPVAYRVLWLLYMNDNNGTKAGEVFKKAVAVDSELDPYYWVGLYCMDKNDLSKARLMFEGALKRDPGNLPVYYQLGKVYLLLGTDLNRGLGYFEKFLKAPRVKNAPGPEHAYWRMGMIYEKLGKLDSARAAYRKSLELNPGLEEPKKALEKLK